MFYRAFETFVQGKTDQNLQIMVGGTEAHIGPFTPQIIPDRFSFDRRRNSVHSPTAEKSAYGLRS